MLSYSASLCTTGSAIPATSANVTDVTANLVKRQGHVLPNYMSLLPLGLVANNHDWRVGVGMFQIGWHVTSGFGDRQVDTTAKTLVQRNDNK